MKIKNGIRRRALLAMAAMTLSAAVAANASPTDCDDYNIINLKVDTLPRLNIPRMGHATLWLNGEPTVLGGHTDGFVITPTAEYLRDGKWHTVPLAYGHDAGIALLLRSSKVLLAGGHKEDLGIEQLFSVELYDPVTHSSQGFGCMDQKRAYNNALEMADGQVIISGNWFADDGIEMFANVYDPKLTNAVHIKDASLPRSNPYIIRISEDDAIIFSSLDNKAEQTSSSTIDRLKGPSYHEPFLDKWQPIRTYNTRRSTNHFIGNEAEGRYVWLVPVEDDSTGQVAMALVEGPEEGSDKPTFSLLPTEQQLPLAINGNQIIYSSLVCDRDRSLAYLVGNDDDARIYVVAIDYSVTPSPLTVYVTEPQPFIAQHTKPALTDRGDLLLAGGRNISNFFTTNSVIVLPLGMHDDDADAAPAAATAARSSSKHTSHSWVWIIVICLLSGGVGAVLWSRRKSAEAAQPEKAENETEPQMSPEAENIDETPDLTYSTEALEASDDASLDKNLPREEFLADLFNRIEQLMEREHLYLNPNLRAVDVAVRVGTNTAYISSAINTRRGYSFSQYLAYHRISYAQELMRQRPDAKISTISTHSGFSTDSTFFRAFRAVTGMTPKEWLSQIQDNPEN